MRKLVIYILFFVVITACVRPPKAAFAPSNFFPTPGEIVTFSNNSTNADGFEWDFGNKKTSTEKDPFTSYDVPGTYTIHLTVRNTAGFGSSTGTIQVIP